MKILLMGEYSNVHATLAEGLRLLGHQVTVLSNGDFWKDYPRDINMVRTYTKWGGMLYLLKLYSILPRLCGYDIVQLINPMFLELRAERIYPFYRYLKKHNKRIILGAYGMDWYWVSTCSSLMPLRYSDFNIGKELRMNADAIKERHDWMGTAKEKLNRYIADDCDGIVAGLYEYWVCYQPAFPKKTIYIPLPIRLEEDSDGIHKEKNGKIRLFIGINKERSEYKGTDIMLAAAKDIEKKYKDCVEVIKVESIPFREYRQLMEGSDAILDQLYSYTPSMNSLLAMSKGIVCIGGGEEESYHLIHEQKLRPIINVQPNYNSVYQALEQLLSSPDRIPELKRESKEYVRRHHEYRKVAQEYASFYQHVLERKHSNRE